MSDYGVFEASSTDGYEEDQRQRQATRDLGRAIEAAREGFGDFLGAATDKQDYKDRLALVMNDLMQKVADSGVMPVPGVMRKVKAALRPEFRKAADEGYDSWRADMDKIEKVFDDADTWGDLAPDWALKSREEMIELGEERGYITSRRKQADVHWYDQNGRQEAHFAGGEHITVFPDGKWEVSTGAFLDSGQAPSVEQAKAESLEALSLLAFGSRKQARTEDEIRKARDDLDKELTDALDEGGRGDEVKELRQKLRDIDDELSDSMRESSRKQAYNDGEAAEAAAAWAESLGYNDPWGFASWLVGKGYLYPMSDSEYQQYLQEFQAEDDPGVYGSSKQASVEDLRSYVENKGLTTSDKDNGFTFPTADGAKGHIYENRAGDIVVQTLIGGSGGGVQSNYSQDETELVKEWIDRTASRKQADYDEYRELLLDYGATGDINNASLPELVSTFESLIDLLDEDGDVDTSELRSALEDLIYSSRTLGRRKHADDYVKGDALNFINHLQNGGYRMPKDAGYPGEGGQMDDELYDYTNGDQNRISEITRFLQENWDFYAYGASRKTATPKDTLIFDSLSELLLNGGLSPEDEDAIERAYDQAEQGKWQAAYNSVTFVADGPDLSAGADRLVESILDDIESLVGDPSRKARRKQALELGEWEEDLPGLGYAKATKTPGGGWEVYIWDEAGQNETLTPVNSPEEARRLFQDTIKSYPGSGYEYIDF